MTYEAATNEVKDVLSQKLLLPSTDKAISKESPVVWFLLGAVDWKVAIKSWKSEHQLVSATESSGGSRIDNEQSTLHLYVLLDDIQDQKPLTPSHLLHGKAMTKLQHHLVAAEDLQDLSYDENVRLKMQRYNHYCSTNSRQDGNKNTSHL